MASLLKHRHDCLDGLEPQPVQPLTVGLAQKTVAPGRQALVGQHGETLLRFGAGSGEESRVGGPAVSLDALWLERPEPLGMPLPGLLQRLDRRQAGLGQSGRSARWVRLRRGGRSGGHDGVGFG